MTNKCKRKAIVVLLSWCVSVSDCFALTQIKRQTLARLACNNSSKTPPPTVTIVGGGVGGLAIACRVKHAQPTARVVILEKNSHVGGRCGSFHVATNDGTFRHERGPSLLLLPHVFQELFVECGSTSEQHGLVMQPCVPAYQVVFDDGDRIDLGFPVSNDKQLDVAREASRQKMNELEMNGANKWDEYMAACQAFLDCGLPNFIEQRFDLLSLPAFVWQSLRRFAKAWPLKPHSDVLDAFFDSDKIKAMASFQDLYVGLEPYRNNKLLGGGIFQTTAPAVFGLLAAIELHPTNKKCGVFAPIGGFESVTKSLVSLATSLGVEMVLNRTVTKIIDDGVTTCHTNESTTVCQFHPSDVVIVNADLPYATACLLNQEINHDKPRYDWSPKRGALNYSFSSGVIAFHWSLNKSLTDLNTNNVFLAAKSRDDAEQSWNRDQHAACTLPFNFYVHRASKTDPPAAPKNCDSILVLVPCETLVRQPDCANLPREDALQRYKQQFNTETIDIVRKAVFERMSALESLRDIESLIVNEVVDTPATYADFYNVGAGTPFALSHGLGQLSLSRPGFTVSNHPNVVFVGASTRPGNGVPLVLISAKLAANTVLEKLEKRANARM